MTKRFEELKKIRAIRNAEKLKNIEPEEYTSMIEDNETIENKKNYVPKTYKDATIEKPNTEKFKDEFDEFISSNGMEEIASFFADEEE